MSAVGQTGKYDYGWFTAVTIQNVSLITEFYNGIRKILR
jgi:hypothetical protein